MDEQSGLMIRSSVNAQGVSKPSGKDSIRLWLINSEDKPLGSKIDSWTKRIPGWQDNLNDKILELAKRRELVGDCPKCDKPIGVYKVKMGLSKNKGKLYAKCWNCDNWLGWLDEIKPDATYFSKTRHSRRGGTPIDKCAPSTPSSDFIANEIEVSSSVDFKPNQYQKDIFEFVKSSNDNGIVNAVAGSGKTTTNVMALELLPKSTKSIHAAFNKHIERDIEARVPQHVKVSTFHSWGLGNIRQNGARLKINQYKIYDIIDNLKLKDTNYELKQSVSKLISLLKGGLLEPTQKNILRLADDFCIDIEPQDTKIVTRVFDRSIQDMKVVDFDDMIYYPASGIVPCEKYEYIFVDEAQDMNTAQIRLATNSMTKDSRILLIGDPWQSMYGFIGAFIGVMDYMQDKLSAVNLPLSISYRAPLAIVNLVNDRFPYINFEASQMARNGNIQEVDYNQFYDIVQPSHGVICRTNAPLVKPCFNLIRQGIKATILGRNIGQGLVNLIKKRERLVRVTSLDELLKDIQIYRENEVRKLTATKKVARAALLEDQCETIYALAEGCQTIDKLKEKTTSTFSDEREGVVFSSIHKAKGLEWESVHILEPHLLPHPMAKGTRDLQQEQNIEYVAITRTKNNLYFVR